ncbi:MAG: flagellar biosynthesis GTPase FlhF [Paraglaciecola sp.]|jgi:flagellar biosynthesis GTPase FlhF
MYNKLVLLFALNFCTIFAFSQTKFIHHKSHSGSTENFFVALDNSLFDIGESNFGMVPTRIVRTSRLDSLIYLTDTSTIMVTKEVCRNEYEPKADPEIWKAGRDTVYNHALFTLKYELDSIKETLGELYNFQNPVEEMIFVGYENEYLKMKLTTSQDLIIPTKKEYKKLRKVLKNNNNNKDLKSSKQIEKAKKKLKKANEELNEATKRVEEAEEQLEQRKFKEKTQAKEQQLIPFGAFKKPPLPASLSGQLSITFLLGIVAVLSLLMGLIYWKFNQFSKPKLAQ